MSSDHLTRTVNNFRQNVVNEALVKEMTMLSPTVKGVTLKVSDSTFTFLAGQWVDVFIPGIKQVGGFSMCSAPTLLKKSSILQLAVKLSNSPPAKWMHEQCKIGDKLQLRAGGDTYLEISNNNQQMPDILLIAGGVGINPLWSMVQEIKEQNIVCHHKGLPNRVTLLYSSRSADELLFKDALPQVKEDLGESFSYKLFVTQRKSDSITLDPNLFANLMGRRIQAADIENALNNSNRAHLCCFLCGPPTMIDDCRNVLQALGVSEESIRFEKWW